MSHRPRLVALATGSTDRSPSERHSARLDPRGDWGEVLLTVPLKVRIQRIGDLLRRGMRS